MLLTLPVLALLALAYCFAQGAGWRDGFLRALVVCGAATVLLTEALGAINAVRPVPLAVFWAVVASGSVLAGWRAQKPKVKWPGWVNAALIASTALISCVVLLTALASAPNSTDAMAYHLPRVIYWIQAGNVSFFATPYLNQISLQPMSEYVMLHTYLLSGGDAFVNTVQWLGSVGCIVGVSLIARALGAGLRGQSIAALFCATLPNGILQASGAKNEYVLALWLVAMVWFGLEYRRAQRRVDLLLMGLALALALFTKGTAYLFAPPFVVFALWRRSVPAAALLAGCVLLINGPLYVRNLDLSGSPLGFDSAQGDGVYRWRNEHFTWGATASNILRNTSEQLGSRSAVWNRGVYESTLALHRKLGLNPDDPDATFRGSKFDVPRNANHEVDANNRWHLLFAILFTALLLWRRSAAAGLGLACATAFLLFCFYLRWQPFQARMLLPLFVLTAPMAGVALEGLRCTVLQIGVCVFLLSGARLPLLQNWIRPLVGPESVFRTTREQQYFADMTHWHNRQQYLDTVAAIRQSNCYTIGIDANRNSLEYPLQALLLRADKRYRFVHTGVHNASAKYAKVGITPCVVACIDCGSVPELRSEVGKVKP